MILTKLQRRLAKEHLSKAREHMKDAQDILVKSDSERDEAATESLTRSCQEIQDAIRGMG